MGEIRRMKKETLDILADAISEAGSWQWWHTAKDLFQLEFCRVMLYDETRSEKEPHSSVIALRFYGSSFAVFLDELEEAAGKAWLDRIRDDEIAPFPIDTYAFRFDDADYAQSVYDSFRNKTPVKDFPGTELFKSAGHILAAKCGDVGFVVGGDELAVVGKGGEYREEEIGPAVRKWWKYWRDYWLLRKTRDAYEKDWACENTIPADKKNPIGNW